MAVTYDGQSGLRLAATLLPQAILCDVGLPGGMDGYPVDRALRANPDLAGVRLIALAGYGQDEDPRRTQAAGFDVHLVKPVELEELLVVLIVN